MVKWEDMAWCFTDKVLAETGPYAKYSYQEVGYSWDWGAEEKIKQKNKEEKDGTKKQQD